MSGTVHLLLIFLFVFIAALTTIWIARRPAMQRIAGHIVATNLTLFGAAFLFFAGFIAAEVYGERSDANAAMTREVSALRQVMRLAATFEGDDGAGLTAAIHAYVEAVTTDEWPVLATGGASIAAEEAFQHLALAAFQFTAAEGATSRLAQAVDTVFIARHERIDLAGLSVGGVKWLAFGVLGFVSMLVVALINAASRSVQVLTVALYGTVIFTILGVIAVQDRPFSEPLQIPPDIYHTLAGRMPDQPS